MHLDDALDQIRETIVKHPVSSGKSLWSVILRQIRSGDCFGGRYADEVEEVVRSFVGRLNDSTLVSLWRETETGMVDDSDHAELFPDSVRMDLEMELLDEITSLAWEEAQEDS